MSNSPLRTALIAHFNGHLAAVAADASLREMLRAHAAAHLANLHHGSDAATRTGQWFGEHLAESEPVEHPAGLWSADDMPLVLRFWTGLGNLPGWLFGNEAFGAGSGQTEGAEPSLTHRILHSVPAEDDPLEETNTFERRQAILAKIDRPLPLANCPTETEIEAAQTLAPWFREAGDAMLSEIMLARRLGGTRCHLTAVILAGPPGIGKSRYLEHLVRTIGRRAFVQPMAGLSEALTILGSNATFPAAQPSLPVRAVLETGCADPVVILDEIDKVGDSVQHGHPLEALLPLLEPGTAARFRDPFLDRVIDASQITWLATANETGTLPQALRSRMTILWCNGPGPQHLDAVLAGFAAELAARFGVPAERIPRPGDLQRLKLEQALRRSPDLRGLQRLWQETVLRLARPLQGVRQS